MSFIVRLHVALNNNNNYGMIDCAEEADVNPESNACFERLTNTFNAYTHSQTHCNRAEKIGRGYYSLVQRLRRSLHRHTHKHPRARVVGPYKDAHTKRRLNNHGDCVGVKYDHEGASRVMKTQR